jgi:hypothetical protein
MAAPDEAEDVDMAESAAITVTMDGRVVKRKPVVDWRTEWAARATRKNQGAAGLERLATGNEKTSAVARNKNAANADDPVNIYASNIAKIKVPTQIDAASGKSVDDATYHIYNKMDSGAKIFMQLCRANTRMGAAVSMITTYSRGRTTRLLQLITKTMAASYNFQEDSSLTISRSKVFEDDIAWTKNMAELVEYLQKLCRTVLAVLNRPESPAPTADPDVFAAVINPFYSRFLVDLPYKLAFHAIALPPPYRNRQKSTDRIAAYLNEPFFQKHSVQPYKYVPNPRYLSQRKKPFTMVRKGFGLLASALQHFWNAGITYDVFKTHQDTEHPTPNRTFYRLIDVYKNITYASYFIMRNPAWVDQSLQVPREILTKPVLTRAIKDFYYNLRTESQQYYALLAFSVRLMSIFNQFLHSTGTIAKRAMAKDVMKHANAEAKTAIDFITSVKEAYTNGTYTAQAMEMQPAELPTT